MLANPETRARARILEKWGIEIPGMPESEKQLLGAKLGLLKLRVCFGDREFPFNFEQDLNPRPGDSSRSAAWLPFSCSSQTDSVIVTFWGPGAATL